jgi:hypothetical protein
VTATSLPALRNRAARLAEALYAIETDPEYLLLNEAGPLAGRSAAVAADARARVARLWDQYPLLSEAVDRVEEALTDGNQREAARLLGPGMITRPDGSTTSVASLLEALEVDLREAMGAAHQIATTTHDIVPRIDRLRSEVDRLSTVAADLGIADDRDLARAGQRTDRFASEAASDPLGVDLTAAESAVRRAAARIDDLAHRRTTLPERLEAAQAELEEIGRLVVEGGELLARAEAEVARPSGLLRPVDPAAIDSGPRALRPWLERIAVAAAGGDWPSASAGLDHWRRVADGWRANARRVVEANRVPFRRRDELRGLLDAYEAKAAASGSAADPDVERLYQKARAALAARPCDLDAAGTAVDVYRAAVNRVPARRDP